jgi:hypothetical protein
MEFDGAVVEWCKAEFEGGRCGVGIVFKGGKFVVLRIPDLKELVAMKYDKGIVCVNWWAQFNEFLLCGSDGELMKVSIG